MPQIADMFHPLGCSTVPHIGAVLVQMVGALVEQKRASSRSRVAAFQEEAGRKLQEAQAKVAAVQASCAKIPGLINMVQAFL